MGKRVLGVAGRARWVVVAGVLVVSATDGCSGEITGEVIESSVGGAPVAPRLTGGIQAGRIGVGGYMVAGRAGIAGAMPMGGYMMAGRAGIAGAMPMGGYMMAGKAGIAGAMPMGGYMMAGAAPVGGRAGTAGAAPTVCALGYACSTPGSYCVSGSITCLCNGGIWAACSITPGTGGTGGATPTGLPTPNGSYTYGSYTGTVWGEADTAGSTITLTDNNLCASGTVVRVPYDDAGPFDSGDAWGALLGWNLNEPILLDGGIPSPASVAGKTSITVGLVGATGLNLRVELEARDSDAGAPVYYCASLPATGATIPLTSLTKRCWIPGGVAFDPATMQPVSLEIQVVTDRGRAYPFNFCVTALGIW